MVTDSTGGTKSLKLNSPIARACLRSNYRAGTHCWLWDVRLQQTVIGCCGVVDTCGFVWLQIANGRFEAQLKTGEGT